MGAETKFYFANRVQPSEIALAIEKEFGVSPDMKDIRFETKRIKEDFDRHYGYIRLIYNNITYLFYFFQYNHIYGGERDKTNPDTVFIIAKKM